MLFLQRKIKVGGEVVHPVAGVETLTFHFYGQHAAFPCQGCKGIGQLDFPAVAGFDFTQVAEDIGRQHIASDNRQIGRSLSHSGLLYHIGNFIYAVTALPSGNDAILVHLVRRHFHDADDRLVLGTRHVHQLLHTRHFIDDQIVAHHDHKRFIPHGIFRAQHGVPQPELLFLPYGHDVHHFSDLTHLGQQLLLARSFQHAFQLKIVIKVILDDALFPVGDKHNIRHAGMHGLFHNILDDRLVVDGQHFLGNILARRQRPSSPASHGNNNLAYIHSSFS